ncbi:MAG: heterodisulfide reductase-related iron-sulfur binding cluster, partial [Desulfobulbaceae bacterium]|nr:heterodisulfide reductase-related iron-sulfur binding cluster [Desulfobulbaceae bacterium]
ETDKCCGFGGLFQIGYPGISRSIFERGYDVVKRLEPTVVLTSCSGCHIWWSMELARLKSPCACLHPASLLASYLPDAQ